MPKKQEKKKEKKKASKKSEPEEKASASSSTDITRSGSKSASEPEEKASKSSSAESKSASKSASKSESKSSESSASGTGEKSEKKSGSKSSSESSSEKSSESSSENSSSESGSDKKEKLVQIDKDYKPRGPSSPIPSGYEDCFGKYPDPDVHECQVCLEAENCMAVKKAKDKAEGGDKDVKKKHKGKEKKASEKESKSKSKSKSESKSEAEEPKKKKGKTSEAVQKILDESGFEKRDGKLKTGRINGFVLVHGKKALKIKRIKSEDKFIFVLKTTLEPKAFGLKNDRFKKKGKDSWQYTGKPEKLGGYLATYFKSFKDATKKSKSESK